MDEREVAAMVDHEDRHWWHRIRRRIVRDELTRIAASSHARLLDAGCGTGRMLDALDGQWDVSGLEALPTLVSIARERGHDVRQGVVEQVPWADGQFDLITCLDVLEHTADDHVALLELRRVARQGGRMLVTVPAYQSLWGNHDLLNHHYRRYNQRTLIAAAQEAGLTVERITFFNALVLAPAVAMRLTQRLRRETVEQHKPDSEVGGTWLDPVIELPLRVEASWLRRDRTLPAGLSLLAVLRR